MITDKEIEHVARRMCVEMGVDPDEDRTGAPPRFKDRGMAVMDCGWIEPLWRQLVPAAEMAIAGHRAVASLEAAP